VLYPTAPACSRPTHCFFKKQHFKCRKKSAPSTIPTRTTSSPAGSSVAQVRLSAFGRQHIGNRIAGASPVPPRFATSFTYRSVRGGRDFRREAMIFTCGRSSFGRRGDHAISASYPHQHQRSSWSRDPSCSGFAPYRFAGRARKILSVASLQKQAVLRLHWPAYPRPV